MRRRRGRGIPEDDAPSSSQGRGRRRPQLPEAHEQVGAYARIYRVVSRIPRGRVATYGQVAELARVPGGARQVGYALSASGEVRVPWHRVVNRKGEISPRSEPAFEALQRQLLAREGVALDASGRLSLARFRWRPRGPSSRSTRKTRRSGAARGSF